MDKGDGMKQNKTDEIIRKIQFGVDYYPEHWPRERWEKDASLMQEMGIQVVRMGEFSWHKMEPEMGKFDFKWLSDAVELLGQYGIYTILGTPTAAPPAWIIERNPEILPVDSNGQRKSFGGRHHDCQSNITYREHIRRLVTAMAEYFKDQPYVIGWQIDNELGNSHEDLCMCDSCKKAFQKWLQNKYHTIENLNTEWGTGFWSQDYDRFEQIPVPRKTPTVHNPSLLLDFKRFCSDLIIDFQNFQIDLIRQIAPQQKITHNLMGFYDKTNYYKLAQRLDFASNDQYPTGYYFDPPGESPYQIAACMDLIRSIKKQNFWMMEMEAGPTGGGIIGANPRPGQNRLWTTQSVAHGADTVIYFRWRTCLFGTEQFWHGILPHNGVPQRRYEEIKSTIQELRPVMEDVHGITMKANVGIVFSYDEDWALKNQPQNPDLNYVRQIQKYYEYFYDRNIPIDFLAPEDDLSSYKIVIAPLLYLMTRKLEEKLIQYTKNGGILVLTMRTGVMDYNNKCMSEYPLPGRLGEILGLEVEEYDSLYHKKICLCTPDGKKVTAKSWCDIIKLRGAESFMNYASEYYEGRPAVTKNYFKRGVAWYIGTDPEDEARTLIMDAVLKSAGMNNVKKESVEMIMRKGRQNDYLFVMNHSEERQYVTIEDGWLEVKQIGLEPYGVVILKKSREV